MLFFLGLLLIIAGGVLAVGASIWFYVEAFRTGVIWGLAVVFLPFGALIWLITHWENGKTPFLYSILGAIPLGIGMVLITIGAPQPSTSNNALVSSRNAVLSNPSGELPSDKKPDAESDGDEDVADDEPDVLDAAKRNADAANAAGSEDAAIASDSAATSSDAPPLPDAPAAPPPPPPPPPSQNSELDRLEAMMSGATATAMNQPPRNFPPASAPAQTPGPATAAGATLPPSIVVEGVPVETLWPPYFAAVQKLRAGDISGVREIEKVLSRDDIQWLNQNAGHIVQLVSPGAMYAGEQAKLVALNAMLRNMPQSPQSTISAKARHGVAVAELTDSSSGTPQRYSSVLVQESGRWVLAHMFYTRDFVWVPQLAYYKQARGLPMTNEEKVFLTQGFQPFQQQVQTVYKSVGYGG